MMKPTLKILALALIMAAHSSFGAGLRDDLWRRVNDAMSNGLPKTAITNLEPIIAGALKDKAYAEATKAIAKKILLEGGKLEEQIVRMEAETARAPKEMAPVLETVLAHWYWNYFYFHRWQFIQRSATATAPGKDFTTWDLPRLFAEIERHFVLSLAAEKLLKATPISAWDDLIEKGAMPDSYQPTLYDFILHESLKFYTSAYQAAAKPEDAFELSADSPIFLPAGSFLEWVDRLAGAEGPKLVGDTNVPPVKALKLYRELLRFHQSDPAPRLAFAAADLERLTWGWNVAVGEDKNARYKAALEVFIRANTGSDITALAYEREARVLEGEGDLTVAHELAGRGANLFPKSTGAKLCRNLIREFEAKSADIATERVWNAPWPKIFVQHRNITNIYFRAFAVDWARFPQPPVDRPGNLDGHAIREIFRPGNLSEEASRGILARTPARVWSVKLPPTLPFEARIIATGAPEDLKPGYYLIVASPDESFEQKDNVVSMTEVWVSDLALVARPRGGNIEGFVLEANSGEPVGGAEISVWYDENRVADAVLATDENGFFSMKSARGRRYILRARHKGHELSTAWDGPLPLDDFNEGGDSSPRADTVFFLDRAIYRPGQIIQYKGICLLGDLDKDNYAALAGESVTVVFSDPNGKEIARNTHRANAYGSFSGSFTAPRDRLMGQMFLETEGRMQGQTGFRVEEYKRPSFEAALDAPKTAAKLNESIRLTGHAMGYAGAAVDGAKVQYRVVREAYKSQEIAHGATRTETDGSFKIEFKAIPDPKILEKDEPTFVFQIFADVTDSAGETRPANREVRVGYAALEAALHADDWQTEDKPVELRIETKTLDGDAQTAKGRVKIYQLQPPEKVQRASLGMGNLEEERADNLDFSNPNNWPQGRVVAEQPFITDTNGGTKLSFALGAGAYRAVLEAQDPFGHSVTGKLPLQVVNPNATRLEIKVPHLLVAPNWEMQPGDEFKALWGTGYDQGRAFVEIEHRNKILRRFWTEPGRTQQQIQLAVTEAMRGGFTLHVTQVRENRAYLETRKISVPWKNKELTLAWEHFTSKLQPGQKETWTATITGPGAEKSAAEMVAALYDESLDAFTPHDWPRRFDVFREDDSTAQTRFLNFGREFNQVFGGRNSPDEVVQITFRHFPSDVMIYFMGFDWFLGNTGFGGIGGGGGVGGMALDAQTLGGPTFAFGTVMQPPGLLTSGLRATVGGGASGPPTVMSVQDVQGISTLTSIAPPSVDLSHLTARKNLSETAFFYPQLMSDSNGVVRMTFTMPEALTKWRFLGFAHDQKLRAGLIEGHAFTAKELMVQPNPPRFLREGDTVEFTVKVSNQSDQRQTGHARLTFAELDGGRSADKLLGNVKPEQDFDIPAKESRGFSWRVTVPSGAPFLSYKAVAATSEFSDGEEGPLPVLSRRVLVTESMPLSIRGPATKKYKFKKLAASGKSRTLQNRSLTVQMVSNPAWDAVLALPYLMDYPYECAEQTFNRLYANALARNIANRDPKIRAVFDQWKNTPALDSPLEKNQDLKSVMLEETPWLREARNESQARRNVGVLFDNNRLNYETEMTLRKLTEMQLEDGRWPWFPGGPANDYITLYIVSGFGRLRHLGADIAFAPAARSVPRLDAWMAAHYEEIQKHQQKPDDYVPGPMDALYLYGLSFFLDDVPIASQHKTAVEFFLNQARRFWLQTGCRQSQGQVAIALKRWGGVENLAAAQAIMRSIKERSVSNPELGMFWRDTELSWWWYHAPIETQALMIEAFDEVMNDRQSVEDCRGWLLTQKQTQDWKTTKATADAIYALLLRGTDLLSSTGLVEVTMGGKNITPKSSQPLASNTHLSTSNVEPGTGLYEVRFAPADIKPKLATITVRKSDPGIAWGGIHWQYLEDIRKIKPSEDAPLKLTKTMFTKINSPQGPVLKPAKGAVAVGDELVVRLELRADRDMDYVHLKDQRGSGTEPVNVLSQYKYQDGLSYYESTRDTASHFFIDYLPKGVYVFEYSTRVQLRGEYQTGIAEIQCLYAPEFNSHSESLALTVN